MKSLILLVFSLASLATLALCEEELEKSRDSKLLPLFQVVRFPNDMCTGTTRNGTCYTAEECSNKGGTSGGSCASGFGVCCILSLACGGSSSDNNTYIVQASATTVTSPCKHTICPASTNICRIRYDFTTFVTAGPQTGTGMLAVGTAVTDTVVGSCFDDAFSVSSPGNEGSPIICGTNSGYHMYVDVTPSNCQQAVFQIGPSTSTTRQWDILVRQYACGDTMAGPPGCLQYFTSTFGTVNSYNFPSGTTVPAAAAHLSNQYYSNCFRRASGMCALCFVPTTTGGAAIDQNSFGLSVSPNAMAKSGRDSQCATDYITIPNGFEGTTANLAIAITIAGMDNYCGRFLASAVDLATTATICTRQVPFVLGVNFNEGEAAAAITADMSETAIFPGGIVGFKLTYWQVAGTC